MIKNCTRKLRDCSAKYNEEEHPYIYEHYEVAVIFNMDQEFDEYPYYPQQLEVVYPEKVAPNLWGVCRTNSRTLRKLTLSMRFFTTLALKMILLFLVHFMEH